MSSAASKTSAADGSAAYDNKSDASNHRRATEVMLAATEAEGNAPIVTFCPYAGKPGRPRAENGHNNKVSHAILSGTVLWLVCPFVNNCIARIERSGGVRTIDARLKVDPFLGPLHEASHRVYESYVTQTLLKDPEEKERFLKMFVLVDDARERENSKGASYNRKYGNAGVSGPRDLKCFHAVAAQALGGAVNPVGCIVVLYLFYLHDVILAQMEEAERMAEPAGEEKEKEEAVAASASPNVEEGGAPTGEAKPKADPGAPSKRVFAEKKTAFAAYVDDFSKFEAFMNECLAKSTLVIDEATTARLPELTTMSKKMLHALEGHQPFHRKKKRIH